MTIILDGAAAETVIGAQNGSCITCLWGWQWRTDAGKEVCVDASGDGGRGETSVSLLLLYQAYGL